MGLGLGLSADPENLPPLVGDFGPLTVPLVSALSLLALVSLVFASEAVREADTARARRVDPGHRAAPLQVTPTSSNGRAMTGEATLRIQDHGTVAFAEMCNPHGSGLPFRGASGGRIDFTYAVDRKP